MFLGYWHVRAFDKYFIKGREGVLNFLGEGGGVLIIKSCDWSGSKKCPIFGIYHPPPPLPLLMTGP